MADITREQALAFVEALMGWIDFSEEHGQPRSPHARTHLQAVLGYNNLPNAWDYYGPGKWTDSDKARKFAAFLDYLKAVVKALDWRDNCAQG